MPVELAIVPDGWVCVKCDDHDVLNSFSVEPDVDAREAGRRWKQIGRLPSALMYQGSHQMILHWQNYIPNTNTMNEDRFPMVRVQIAVFAFRHTNFGALVSPL